MQFEGARRKIEFKDSEPPRSLSKWTLASEKTCLRPSLDFSVRECGKETLNIRNRDLIFEKIFQTYGMILEKHMLVL